MLTRVLFALALICGATGVAQAQEANVLALGLADHEVTEAELAKGETPPMPHFNTPAVAYVLAADLMKGDMVEITLMNGDRGLLSNSETLTGDQATFLLQAGKRGVPAGGWPEGSYQAAVKITRDCKTIIDQTTDPIPFE